MIKLGESVQCTITETGEWGAYATAGLGERVFINFGELSWERVRTTDQVVSPGDVVEVAILEKPTVDRTTFLGSIKRATVDPWREAQLEVGAIHTGEVMRLGTDIVFIKLANGIVVGVQVNDAGRFSLGATVQVKVDKVDPIARVAIGSIAHPA